MLDRDLARLLSAHDPAKNLAPLDAGALESLRRAIVSSPPVAVDARRTRLPRRRALVFALVMVLALVFTATGWGIYSIFHTAAEVRHDFSGEAAKIELPPGATWHRPKLDDNSLYGGRTAQMQALSQATCAWIAYWVDGYRSHDTAQMQAAFHGFERVRAVMPVHHEGESEDVGGYDASSLQWFDGILAQERAGNPHPAEQHLKANC
jgi:hypothetical protein